MGCSFKHVPWKRMKVRERAIVVDCGIAVACCSLVILNWQRPGICHDYFLVLGGINFGLAAAWLMFGRLWTFEEMLNDLDQAINIATALHDAQRIKDQGY